MQADFLCFDKDNLIVFENIWLLSEKGCFCSNLLENDHCANNSTGCLKNVQALKKGLIQQQPNWVVVLLENPTIGTCSSNT